MGRGSEFRAATPEQSGWFSPRYGVPLGMKRIRPEYLDSDPSDRSVAADVLLLRQEPHEEEDEEEDEGDGKEDDDDDDENQDGYSE